MEQSVKNIVQSSKLSDNDKYYWGYQFDLGNDVIVPYLESNKVFKSGDKVAEVGAAEGGVLAAFVEAGAKEAYGSDIVQFRLDIGNYIKEISGVEIEFHNHNIITEDIEENKKKKYDLVLLRDVIEHLDDTEVALRNIGKMIKQGSYLYVTFPPYHSPFGGHQHTVANAWGKLPYIHLLPNFIFHKLIASGRQNDIGEVKRLQGIVLTPKKFERAAEAAGYEIVKSDFYLLRPVFKMKFGLPAVKITALSALPCVKRFFSLEASYILKKK